MKQDTMRGMADHKLCNIFVLGAFTLIEVIIALAILAIALVVLIRLQVISISMTDHAAQLSRASFLATAKMAEVLAAGYPELGSKSGSVEGEGGGAGFHWQTTVRDERTQMLEEADVTGLCGVYVLVNWGEGRQKRRIQMVTLVADQGPSGADDGLRAVGEGVPVTGKGMPAAHKRSP